MKRNGVVMIITLVLVMILTLAILKSTTITQNYFNDLENTKFYIQFNRTFLDMTKIVKEATEEIKDAKMLAMVMQMPIIISDEYSGLEGVLRIESGAKTLNINHIVDKNGTIQQAMYDVFYLALSEYNLNDRLFFMALVLDTLDQDSDERMVDSEFTHKEGAKMTDGQAITKEVFKEIVNVYSRLKFDPKAKEIPWDKLIGFTGDEVDFNYLTKEIKEILQREYGINLPYDESLVQNDSDISLTDEQKRIFSALRIKYYVPNLQCSFDFNYKGKSATIGFTYHIQRRRIEKIETTF